jgi:hypothetical protein
VVRRIRHTRPLWRTAAAVALFLLAKAFGLPALGIFRNAQTTLDPVRIDRASTLVKDGIIRRRATRCMCPSHSR